MTTTSRIFLIRHGDTDWITGGKHASRTEVPLSKQGEVETELIRERLMGEKELIDPMNVAKIYCSPREATVRTVQLLRLGMHNHQHFFNRDSGLKSSTPSLLKSDMADPYVQITKALQEWDYGEYEGLTDENIHEVRKQKGVDVGGQHTWNIWKEGCPGGETPQQVSDRLDELITEMKCVIEARSSGWPLGQDADQQRNTQAQDKAQDIVCVAHGHVLAAMALRWVGLPLGASATRMIFEPAGVAALGFERDDIAHPCIILGRRPGRPGRSI